MAKFQSTPPRGGRRQPALDILTGIKKFQSTPPRGGRPGTDPTTGAAIYVSIHAPARGATAVLCGLLFLLFCFNPRPRAGGDLFGVLLP